LATRHQVRESIVGLLYAKDIGNDGIDKFADDLFEEKKIRNQQLEFAQDLYSGIKNNLTSIDGQINEYLKEWNLSEIGNVERAILRLGTYEIMHSDLDDAVIINEAIELAKNLCNDTSPKFINGVLDAIYKSKEAK
jgi:N utilization substance protein B